MMNPLLRRKPSVVLVSAEAFPFAGTRASAAGMQALPNPWPAWDSMSVW